MRTVQAKLERSLDAVYLAIKDFFKTKDAVTCRQGADGALQCVNGAVHSIHLVLQLFHVRLSLAGSRVYRVELAAAGTRVADVRKVRVEESPLLGALGVVTPAGGCSHLTGKCRPDCSSY